MKGHFKLLIAALATAILAGPFGHRLALAQSAQSAPTQAAQSAQPPFALQYEGRITIRADRTATDVFTHRMKILTPSAIAAVSQQQLRFVEGMETLGNLAFVHQLLGEYPQARELQALALGLFRELGDRQGEAITLSNLALVHYSQGEYPQAREQYTQALGLYRELGENSNLAVACGCVAALLAVFRRWQPAFC